MDVVILFHKTCPTSIKLLEALRRENLLDRVELVDVGVYPFEAVSRGMVSVPAIYINDKIFDFGPINIDRAVKLIKKTLENESAYSYNPKEKLVNTVLDNLFLAITTYLSESLTPLLEYLPLVELLEVKGEKFESFKKEIEKEEKEILGEIGEKLVRVIAYNFIKELYWINKRKLKWKEFTEIYSDEVLKHWFLARSTIARIGLNLDRFYLVIDEKIKQFKKLLYEKWDRYWENILK